MNKEIFSTKFFKIRPNYFPYSIITKFSNQPSRASNVAKITRRKFST